MEGADILGHGKALQESGSVLYNYKFALFIDGADVKAHGKVIIDSGDLGYNLAFAEIPGADVRAHGDIILQSKNAEYNYKFAKLPGADIEAHGKVIAESKDARYNYLFASMAQDITPHRQAVIESGDADINYLFAKDFGGNEEEIKAHERVIINSKNATLAIKFAEIEGADVEALGKVVVEYGSAEQIVGFAGHYRWAKLPNLQQTLIKRVTKENVHLLEIFKKLALDTDTEELDEAISRISNIQVSTRFSLNDIDLENDDVKIVE